MLLPIVQINTMLLNMSYSYYFIQMYLSIMSYMFLMTLLFIFNSIIKFSTMYMSKNPNMNSFKLFMFGFLLSMVFLLLTDSLISLLISWELLGVTSYLLVLYYYNWSSLQGSFLTMMTNRLGDSFLMMFMLMFNFNYFFMTMLFFTLMCFTKSSQYPFMSWLPAAMAAPTPTSALVHSSTLVTAGIYIFMKFYIPMFSKMMQEYLLFISVLTMMSGSMMALLSMDVKKIIAFSTLSQLGFMIMIFYSLYMGLTIYHLLVHAFLKSFMFMIVGVIMMATFSQSVMKSKLNLKSTDMINIFLVIFLNFSNFILSAMFMSKEYSSNLITSHNVINKITMMMILLMTLFYMKRLYYLLFLNFISYKMKFKMYFNFSYIKVNMFFMMFMFFSHMWIINIMKNIIFYEMHMIFLSYMFLLMYLKFNMLNLFGMLNLILSYMNKLNLKFLKLLVEDNFMMMMKYNLFFIMKMILSSWSFILLMYIMLLI